VRPTRGLFCRSRAEKQSALTANVTVAEGVPLAFLAPSIVEAIIIGGQPVELTAQRLITLAEDHILLGPDQRSPRAHAPLLLRKGRSQQLSLDFGLGADTAAMETIWRDAEEGERRSRARFAQNTLKPEEVIPEWQRWRELLGSPEQVHRFVDRAMSRLNAPLELQKGDTVRAQGSRKRLCGRAGSLIAPSPPSSHTTPHRFEIDAAPPSGLERPNFACLLGGFGQLATRWRVIRISNAFRFLRRLYDRLRSGNFVFKCANRLPQQDDRSLPALRKILARLVSLRIVSCWSTNWTQGSAAKRGICDEGAGVEFRGEIIPHVCARAVPECRGQGFVDGRFERDDFGVAKSLAHFLIIESLKACDALLQPLDTTPLLAGGQDRRSGLGRRNRTTGHGLSNSICDKDIITQSQKRLDFPGALRVAGFDRRIAFNLCHGGH
jgi:hypothetical protein